MGTFLVLALLAAEPASTSADADAPKPAAEHAAAAAQAPTPPPERAPSYSATLDTAGPIVVGALLNTWGNFLEFQVKLSRRFSFIAEFTYLHSENFRALDGTMPGLRMQLAIACTGAAFWFFRPFNGPFNGPFISVRIEGRLERGSDGAQSSSDWRDMLLLEDAHRERQG